MRPLRICVAVLFGFLLVAPLAWAEDWPMYRQDAGRRGVTSHSLPSDLQLVWARQLPPLTPAFHNSRLQFDSGYEPIVADGKVLIASSRDDCVTAYSAVDGTQIWRFTTNGPVRFAPAIWKDSVCFGSDDGCMYCVELKTGKLRWKHRAVPSQRRLLGNRRLISVWPVRGGPVVADGQVYFAAGVWPFEGVFVYAMNITSGKVSWRNDRMGYLFGQQPHNTEAIGGLAPQGYLVINGDEVIVPCSTAYPARLNRHTGKLIEFELPGAGRYPGGWFASLDPDTARAIRRGKLTFDEVVNRQQHEDKMHKGKGGVEGLSREIRAGESILKFDDKIAGVDGTVHSLVVADNMLFVSTRQGNLLCFGDAKTSVGQIELEPPTEFGASTSAQASLILENAASQHGIAIVVGLHDTSLTKSLVQDSKFHVIVFDDDIEKIESLRDEAIKTGVYGERVAAIHCNLKTLRLPPYITSALVSERPDIRLDPLLQTLRPFGGIAIGNVDEAAVGELKPGGFAVVQNAADVPIVRRAGALPGAAEYSGDWSLSQDQLVRFPLGVLWFDDTLAHFKRSPQPQFDAGAMISRPKDWHASRLKGEYKKDYPLLPPVLSDIYTGRVLDDSERLDIRKHLKPTSTAKAEPSQYRPPRQSNAWKPEQPVVGERKNPLTGESEPRAFPKTYGCDGGVDYGDLYTLRAGTAAFYDKTCESGTVFLSGPRSGCTNSIIPSGGVLNVPYFYEGCTCSYPLPTAMSLVAMPESHEQWSAWGESEIQAGKIQRIGINFGAPGDRITRDGTLWLDYPSVGGPSPKVDVVSLPVSTKFRYRHSVWMQQQEAYPWVSASMAEGLERFVLKGMKPGRYLVRLHFAEPDDVPAGKRVQTVKIQGQEALANLDIAKESGGAMRGITKEFADIKVSGKLTLELSASKGKTIVSGIELIRQ